jgi:chlorite dismutase
LRGEKRKYQMVEQKNKETPENGGLRLVADNKEPQKFPVVEKQFVNFMFFRISADWRKLGAAANSDYKNEFETVYNRFSEDFLLYSYSLVGFDSKADFMLWRIGTSLDLVQEMTARLYRTEFGSYLETADTYLSMTKKMMFIAAAENAKYEDRFHVRAGEKKYHFVYPCAKQSEWYNKSGEERDAMVEENFMVGKKFPNIKIHLTHSFGFSEQEYIISFETDEPKDFLALAEELRETSAGKFMMRGMPIYTCRRRSLIECLDALG